MANVQFQSVVFLALAFTTGACGSAPEEPESTRQQGVELSAATKSAVLRVALPKRSADDASARMREVLGVLVGSDVAADAVDFAASGRAGRVAGRLGASSRIVASYEPERDEVDATDLDVAADAEGTSNVGEVKAQAVAERVLAGLVQRGLANASRHDFKNVQVELLKQGAAQVGETAVEQVKEYRYFIPMEVDGITVNDGGQTDFGVRVSVHRSGKVAGIRVSGVGATISKQPGASTVHKLANASLNSRALSDFPNAEVSPLGLRYAARPGHESEPVVAAAAYRVTPETVMDGEVIFSRSMTVYYSLDDTDAQPIIWPQITGHETGDTR